MDPTIVNLDSARMTLPEIPGYEILEELGRGGMATVYLAVQQNFGRKVALKIMSPSLAATEGFSERFEREARIVAGLSHPNVIAVYDVGLAGNHHYLAMELHPGGDLASKINKGVEPKDALRIIRQTAAALNFAHSKGYIHRDVKPDNILFREDGSAVLTDFGIARQAEADTRMTQAGKVVGTPKYMSPEQAKGENVDGRADIYALGVVLFETLTGQLPFDADDPIALGIKHIKDPIPDLPEKYQSLQPLLEKMMAKDPAERYQSGQEVIDAIDHLDVVPSGIHDKLAASSPVNPVARPAKNRTPIYLALGVILAGGIGAGIFLAPQLLEKNTAQSTKPVASQTVAPPEPAIVQPATPSTAPATEVNTLNEDAPVVSAVVENQATASTETSAPEAAATSTTAEPASTPASDAGTGEVPANQEAPAQTATQAPQQTAAAPTVAQQTSTTTQQASSTVAQQPATVSQPAVIQAPAEPAIDDSLKPLIDQLLLEADQALDERRLTKPENNNALDKYNEVLELQPDNQAAKIGIKKIATVYVVLARETAAKNQVEKANEFLAQAQQIAQDAPGLLQAEELIAEAKVRIEVDRLIRMGDDAVNKENINGENGALSYYQQALKLDGKSLAAKKGLSKSAVVILKYARIRADNKKFDEAWALYDQANTIDPTASGFKTTKSHIETAEAKHKKELEEAKHQQNVLSSFQITGLLKGAEAAFLQEQYTSPADNNALDKYREVLKISPGNIKAKAGLKQLADTLAGKAKDALSRGDKPAAAGYLKELKMVNGTHPDIGVIEGQL